MIQAIFVLTHVSVIIIQYIEILKECLVSGQSLTEIIQNVGDVSEKHGTASSRAIIL